MADETLPQMSPLEADELIASGAFLLDVREDEEWVAGHASAATHIPMGAVAVASLPTDRPVICICRVGGRSAAVATALRQAGVDARNLSGGMEAWASAGLPVVDDAGAPGIVV